LHSQHRALGMANDPMCGRPEYVEPRKQWDIFLPFCTKAMLIMALILTPEEHEFLTSILEQRHRELLNEISHTDHQKFKQTLRENQKLLESILNRL
jgi:hypothetical protein